MTELNWNTAHPIALAELPEAISIYIAAHNAGDIDAEVALASDDLVVTDEGNTYTGPAEIRGWLEGVASEYTWTTELIAAAKVDDLHYDVQQRIEGNFPGGLVDLHYRFWLADATKIGRIVIEP